MKEIKLFLLAFIVILCFSVFNKDYFLPSDILGNLPSFNQEYNSSPKNSLLADPIFQFEPWRHFAKEKITKGEFPLWNENNGRGAPFFANPQTAVLYPLNFIYYFFPEKFALSFIPLLKIYIFFVFTYLYLRSLKIEKAISFISSFMVSTSGFFILWVLWPHTNVFLFLPLVLYVTEKISQSLNPSYRWYVVLSFIYFIEILGGHPETLAQIIILHTFYTIFKFWKEKKRYLPILISVLFGFVFGSVQLIPFLEYLLNSHTLNQRNIFSNDFFLPPVSFLMNFFPFILGAPHKEFYKPITEFTNFQETAGGYVGLITIIVAIVGSIKWIRNDNIKFWVATVIFSWIISYQIWPANLLFNLPLFNLLASHRMIGVAGFGLVVLFALSINKLLTQQISKTLIKKINFYLFITLVLIVALNLVLLLAPLNISEKINSFLPFIQLYGSMILITTIVFILLLVNFRFKLTKMKGLILLIPLILQTTFLFYSYNPQVIDSAYYPSLKIINILQNLDKGIILNVGNPMIPANINLFYDLKSIQNNDAIEINNYKISFDKNFKEKNMWGEVDEISYDNVQKFGINYILSDYNINLKKEAVQPQREVILPLVDSANPIKVPFKFKDSYVYGIRFLTANYNRKNNCQINFQIFNQTTQQKLEEKNILCRDVKDLMFYTVNFSEIKLEEENKYLISITPRNISKNNSIGLWSAKNEIPYFEILYKEDLNEEDKFEQVVFDNNLYLWKVPGSKDIETTGKIISQTINGNNYSLEVNMIQSNTLELKIPYFPGWIAAVDNKKVEIKNNNPFMLINVPKGNHFVEFKYQPLSFSLGLIITSISFIIYLVHILRRERENKNLNRFINYFQTINKKHNWLHHFKILTLCLFLSLASLLLIIKVINIKFQMPYTTSVNWLTVHNYPKQQDYFYFFFSFSYLLLSTLLFWITWLWKKNK